MCCYFEWNGINELTLLLNGQQSAVIREVAVWLLKMTVCILSYYRNKVKAGELLVYQTYTAHRLRT